MRFRSWSLVALVCASPEVARAQACLGSPEYAAPAAFVGVHVGRLSAVRERSSARPVAQGATLRGMFGGVVGVARVERAEELAHQSLSTRETREYANTEFALVGNLSPDAARGIRLCPQLGYSRRSEENARVFESYEGGRTYREGRRTDRWFAGLGAAVPFALSSRWSTVPVIAWRRETVNISQFSDGLREHRWTPRPFNALTASLGLAYVETFTLVLEVEEFLGLRLESPRQHGVDEPGARNVRLAVGYHLPSRQRD